MQEELSAGGGGPLPGERPELIIARLRRELAEARQALAAGDPVERAIIQNSFSLVAAIDRNFRLTAFSRGFQLEFERFFGVEVRPGLDLVKSLENFPKIQQLARARWQRALAGEDFKAETEYSDPEKGMVAVEVIYSPLRDAQGAIIGAYYMGKARQPDRFHPAERVRLDEPPATLAAPAPQSPDPAATPAPVPVAPGRGAPAPRSGWRMGLPTVETFRWMGGTWLLLLGMGLLLLPQGSLGPWWDLTWLRGTCLVLAGFGLLWLSVTRPARRTALALTLALALPLLLTTLNYFQTGVYPAAVLMGLVTLVMVYAPLAPPVEGQSPLLQGTNPPTAPVYRPDALGLVLGSAIAVQGLDFLLRPAAAALLPARSGIPASAAGCLFLLGGLGVLFTQLYGPAPRPLRLGAHLLGGGVVLALWAIQSFYADPLYWVLGAATALRGAATLVLPWWSERAARFDAGAYRPRVALALVTAALVPLLASLPVVLAALDQTPAEQSAARQVAFVVAVLLALAAGAAGWWLAGRLTTPVTRLIGEINRIAGGERALTLSRPGSTELTALSRSVEQMARTLDARAREREQLVKYLRAQNQELQQLEQAREESLRALTHDLRNPLTAISSFAQYLARVLERQGLEKEAGHAQTIIKQSQRLNAMLSELVEDLRAGDSSFQPQPVPLNLPEFVLEIRDSLAEAGRIVVERPAAFPLVPADRNYLERILTNLLSNALKYSPPGSPVQVSFEDCGGCVKIAVRDRGEGLTLVEQARLFTRYYRTERAQLQHSGLGLGLYITKKLVEAHGGEIGVESLPGSGTTFFFTLPR